MEAFLELIVEVSVFLSNVAKVAFRAYTSFVDGLGNPWSGFVHSTVYSTIGMWFVYVIIYLFFTK